MKHLIAALLFFCTSAFQTTVRALPKAGVSTITSPNKQYVVSLSDISKLHAYKLKILRNGRELAQYPFEGELVSAYWSPTLEFVAVNNHYGHSGVNVWIISLSNGSIITTHGEISGTGYDRYTDYRYFGYLPQLADVELKRLYSEKDNDQLREGYTSVAYGWKEKNQLLMFHELAFDNFYPNQDAIIQAFTTWNVTNRGVTFEGVRVRKARSDQLEPIPKEVKRTLNFIP